MPRPEDIDLSGLDYEIEPGHKFGIRDLRDILKVETPYWLEDVANIREFYGKFDPEKLQEELKKELDKLEGKLKANV